MKPESRSKRLLGITRSKAKMIEFAVPAEHRIEIRRDPTGLFPLTVAIVGDLAAALARDGQAADILANARQDLRFSAFFLDAFLNGTPEEPQAGYLTLLAATAYYLCDLPGSAAVLTARIGDGPVDRGCRGLDQALAWFLRGRIDAPAPATESPFARFVEAAVTATAAFYRDGSRREEILANLRKLRRRVYRLGSPRELLLADLILAIAQRRIDVSSRVCLPEYTGVDARAWEAILSKPSFIREFWPAQRLLGEQGVFRGRSAVVQMPTSAGKTKATEILIRSAFMSRRTSLAVVVAPFRALCHEIRDSLVIAFRGEEIAIDEISDVPQKDFDLGAEANQPRIFILTPEKLLYLLRQEPEIAPRIGLLVYDEGHQFDTGIRGVTYELLLTSLKRAVPAACQVVLISAVITNAAAINDWLNGDQGLIVAGADLHPNLRSIAFASWLDALGRLEFLGQSDADNQDYFVPRVLEATPLQKLSPREHVRYFPVRDDGQSVAVYLGLKLVPQGTIAIFCGLKASVASVCEKLAEAYRRGLALPPPAAVSDAEEVAKLARLIRRHLGEDGPIAACADLGVFTHHGNTPLGIRLAVEYAMKESLVKMVVCTSTLAQGVNLPIRYLIITGVYQGAEPISVRDFHNLIGRAGRSGMHTEGSVLFADPETFDRRMTRDGRRRWAQIEGLLDPANAKPCASTLLTLFDPLYNDDRSHSVRLRVTAFFRAYRDSEGGIASFAEALENRLQGRGYSARNLISQLQLRAKIIDALESFLMSVSSEEDVDLTEGGVNELVRGTLAYHLADAEQRPELEALFGEIAKHVRAQVPAKETRRAYSKALFGVRNSLAIHAWTVENTRQLNRAENDQELIQVLWPILQHEISNSLFKRCTKPELLPELAMRWAEEQSPAELLRFLSESDVRFGEGQRPRHADIGHVVDLCENALGFEGILVLAAVCEALRLTPSPDEELIERIAQLQKRLKYGLKTMTAIALHELGFADRTVASDLARLLDIESGSRRRIRRYLLSRREEVDRLLAEFPAYFGFVWNNVLRGVRRRS